MTERSSTEFFARRGKCIMGLFNSAALKAMALDTRLLPTDEISLEGRVWHVATSVKGLVFGTPVPPGKSPPTLPEPRTVSGQVGSSKARNTDSATIGNASLKNPVSLLLNSLVTDKLFSLRQCVNQGSLDSAAFETTGKSLLIQLQEAVAYLESLPTVRPDGVSAPERDRITSPSAAKTANSSGASAVNQSLTRNRTTTRPIIGPTSPTGIGSVATMAGAAVLGGAFGYLLGNQSRGHVGLGESHPSPQENTYSYGNAFLASDTNGGGELGTIANEPAVIGFDADKDGRTESFIADTDGDQIADVRATDDDGDGLIDSFETDLDHDGHFDQRFVSEPIGDPAPSGDSDWNLANGDSGSDGEEPWNEIMSEDSTDLDYEVEVDEVETAELMADDEIIDADFDTDGFEEFDNFDFG